MDAELATLATSGATTLVGLAATESWSRAKKAVIDLYERFHPKATTLVAAELEETRNDLEAEYGGAAVQAEIVDHWQTRFRRLLAVCPEASTALRGLIEELAPEAPTTRAEKSR